MLVKAQAAATAARRLKRKVEEEEEELADLAIKIIERADQVLPYSFLTYELFTPGPSAGGPAYQSPH